jgi:hypothetical protein
LIASFGVVVVAATAAGCSDEGVPSAVRHPAASVVRELQDAFEAEDVAGICERMTLDAQDQAAAIAGDPRGSCVRDVQRAFQIVAEGWGDAEHPMVTRVETRGLRADATVEDDEGWSAEVELAREAGSWKLDGFLGASLQESDELADDLRRLRFPERARLPIEVRQGSDEACPPVDLRDRTVVTGGCTFQVAGTDVPIRVLTLFGDLTFSDCSVDYRVATGPRGHALTTDMVFDDSGRGCAGITPCLTERRQYLPWAGRLDPGRHSGYTHRMLMCLKTPVGLFAGEVVTRHMRGGAGWRVRPSNAGTAGFKIDGELTVSNDDFFLQSP